MKGKVIGMGRGEGKIVRGVEKCGEMNWGVGEVRGDVRRGVEKSGRVYGVSVEDAGKCVFGEWGR